MNEFEPYGKDLFTNIERLEKTVSECGNFDSSSDVLFQEGSEGRRSFVYCEISETIIMMLVSLDLLVKSYNSQIGDILKSVSATTDKNIEMDFSGIGERALYFCDELRDYLSGALDEKIPDDAQFYSEMSYDELVKEFKGYLKDVVDVNMVELLEMLKNVARSINIIKTLELKLIGNKEG